MTTAISEAVGVGDLNTTVAPGVTEMVAGAEFSRHDITGGTRRDTNLFHSFSQFSVGSGHIANFLNTPGADGVLPTTSNIFSRVIGGTPSEIFGILRTTDFGSASLFLMNPAGVIFGPTASLELGTAISGTPGTGSFYATTADYIGLAGAGGVNVGTFHADPGSASTLTSAPAAAFGFLRPDAASITVEAATLEVGEGQTVSLVGGNQIFTTEAGEAVPAGVTVRGNLLAPAGHIQLASVASAGELGLPELSQSPNVDLESFTSLGTIAFSDNGKADVSGDPGGTILIRGGELVLDRGFLVANTTGFTAGMPYAVNIEAQDRVVLKNASAITAAGTGDGLPGSVKLVAGNVGVTDGSRILTVTGGFAPAGDVMITGSDSVPLKSVVVSGVDANGNRSRIASEGDTLAFNQTGNVSITGELTSVLLEDLGLIVVRNLGFGSAGDIILDVRNLHITNGGAIENFGNLFDSSGDISIRASQAVTLTGGSGGAAGTSQVLNISDGFGGTGSIMIETKNLSISDGARIRSDTFFGFDDPTTPKVQITATESLSVSDGAILVRNDFTDIGALEISGGTIVVSDLGAISTTTVTDGNGGSITIQGKAVTLSGGGRITSDTEQGFGRGGAIVVSAEEQVSLSGQGFDEAGAMVPTGIFARTLAFGDGGDITIKGKAVSVLEGAQVSSSSLTGSTGAAGSVTIQGLASPADSIILAGGLVLTEALGAGPGGDIGLHGGQIQLDGASVSAQTSGPGDAGTIEVKAGSLSMAGGSTISSSSLAEGSGAAGSVTIQGLASPADSISLSNSQVLTEALGGGVGGDIVLEARDVDLSAATVSTNTAGAGNAGNITVGAANQFLMQNGSALTTTAAQAEEGGNLTVNAGMFRMIDSLLSSSIGSESGTSGGGDITINSAFTILQGSGSQILANAFAGAGGQINVTALLAFLADADSILDASSQLGVSGSVNIQSPVQQLSGALAPLPESVLQAAILLRAACAARMQGGNVSSLVQLGRDTVPAGPEGWLLSPLLSVPPLADGAESRAPAGPEDGISAATMVSRDGVQLRRVRHLGPLHHVFGIDGSSPCGA